MNATRTMPMLRERSQSKPLNLDLLFIGVLCLALVYVALLIATACDYAASIDALALAGGR